MKSWFFISVQLFILWIINTIGFYIVEILNLPIPGNVLGLMILFLLLVTGIIPIRWVEEAANLLIKHLAFFFIPIAVGLMALGTVFLKNGIPLIIIMGVSIVLGIYLTGFVSQFVAQKKEGVKSENLNHTI